MPLDVAATAGVGLAGVAVGAILNAVLGDWRDRRREQRLAEYDARGEQLGRDLEALAQTRRRAHDVVRQLQELAIRPKAGGPRERYELANDALIGDPAVIRDYRELLVDLQQRFGRGLPNSALRRALRVLSEIDAAIAAQEQRARTGEAVLVVGRDIAEDLFDMDAFADRLLFVDQPPTLDGRLGRALVDGLRLWAALRLGLMRHRDEGFAYLESRRTTATLSTGSRHEP